MAPAHGTLRDLINGRMYVSTVSGTHSVENVHTTADQGRKPLRPATQCRKTDCPAQEGEADGFRVVGASRRANQEASTRARSRNDRESGPDMPKYFGRGAPCPAPKNSARRAARHRLGHRDPSHRTGTGNGVAPATGTSCFTTCQARSLIDADLDLAQDARKPHRKAAPTKGGSRFGLHEWRGTGARGSVRAATTPGVGRARS